MKSIIRSALIGALLSSYCAVAHADGITDDVHCYIVSTNMLESSNPAIQTAGTLAMMYFMGKLYANGPMTDLEDRLVMEMSKVTGDVFKSEAGRCGAELKIVGKDQKKIGEDLKKRGAEMLQKENSR